MHAPIEDSRTKASFCGGLDPVFDDLCLYHLKSLIVQISNFMHCDTNDVDIKKYYQVLLSNSLGRLGQ
jgi:hypothetical protein